MILPILLAAIGCGNNLESSSEVQELSEVEETSDAETKFTECVNSNMKLGSFEFDVYTICGNRTDYNWSYLQALLGNYFPKESAPSTASK